jgi:hypothetical protein
MANLEHRRPKSTRVFGNLDAQSAVFTPNAAHLLGVTTNGTVFKIDLAANEVNVIEDVIVEPGPLAVSLPVVSGSDRLGRTVASEPRAPGLLLHMQIPPTHLRVLKRSRQMPRRGDIFAFQLDLLPDRFFSAA